MMVDPAMAQKLSAEDVMALLHLQPHPAEGGYFVETYRSAEVLAAGHLPERYGAPRHVSTCIYYLLTPTTCSALHRLKSDEIFHFYLGDPVEMLQLHPDGSAETIVLGSDLRAGQRVQVLAPRDVWQGSRLVPGGTWALMGTTVAPGFDFADYVHGRREELLRRYPAHAALITALTPEAPARA
jgi:predicted cupin superfamily sugar epimerase